MYAAEFLSCKVWPMPFYSFSEATSMSLLLLRLMRSEAIMFETKLWFVHNLFFTLTLVGLHGEHLCADAKCTIHLCNTQSVSQMTCFMSV
jgi:hypothetical protein